jgi:hypothetical protein
MNFESMENIMGNPPSNAMNHP